MWVYGTWREKLTITMVPSISPLSEYRLSVCLIIIHKQLQRSWQTKREEQRVASMKINFFITIFTGLPRFPIAHLFPIHPNIFLHIILIKLIKHCLRKFVNNWISTHVIRWVIEEYAQRVIEFCARSLYTDYTVYGLVVI